MVNEWISDGALDKVEWNRIDLSELAVTFVVCIILNRIPEHY